MDHVGKAKSVMTWGTLMAQRIPAGDIQPRASFASHCLPSIPFLGNGKPEGNSCKAREVCQGSSAGPHSRVEPTQGGTEDKGTSEWPKGDTEKSPQTPGHCQPLLEWQDRIRSVGSSVRLGILVTHPLDGSKNPK